MESRVYEGGNVRLRVVRNDKAQRFQLKIEYLNAPEVNGAMNLTMRVWPDWVSVERYINRVRW